MTFNAWQLPQGGTMTTYSSHDWRKHTDDAIVVASNIGIQLEANKSKVILTNQDT